ncbi:hypothetical protein ACWGI9_43350 [Streptomyces sp. NPDC054833]
MRRAGASVVGAVAGGLLLGGCSPAELPLAAVALDAEGEPVVIVQPCGDDRIGPASLGSTPMRGKDPAGDPGTSWRQTSGTRIGSTTFRLFSPPRSFEAEKSGVQKMLPGRRYFVHIFGGRGGFDDYNVSVSFSPDDLARLKPGQVWADGRAMSRDDFDDRVGDKC